MISGERTAQAVNPRDSGADDYGTTEGIFINYYGDSWGGQCHLHYSAAVILFHNLTDVLFNYRDHGHHNDCMIDVWRDKRFKPELIYFNVSDAHGIGRNGGGFMQHMTPEDAREFWITLMVAISRVQREELPPTVPTPPKPREKVVSLNTVRNEKWLK